MKKIVVLIFVPFLFLFISCPFPIDSSHMPELDVAFDKREVCVNETIELSAIIKNIYYKNGETTFLFYVENYPKIFKIQNGDIYKPLTTEKYLCITPKQMATNKGFVDVQFTFPISGEYTIKVNGTSSTLDEIASAWNEDFYTYTIVVKE